MSRTGRRQLASDVSHDRSAPGWLLDSDPALRWQVERDLVGAPRDV
jgi:hypothetical protein